jgi:hypothetical protein
VVKVGVAWEFMAESAIVIANDVSTVTFQTGLRVAAITRDNVSVKNP